jgi:selenide,water dikinase
LYKDEQIMIMLAPLAKWCGADFVQKRVKEVRASQNKLIFEDDTELEYDVLALNVGSRTRGATTIPGVWDNSLTTRPINELLGKIQRKEEELLSNNIIPKVVVCGGGAAGVELSFAFKNRWSKAFGTEIDVTLLSDHSDVLFYESEAVRELVKTKFNEKNIKMVNGSKVKKITADKLILEDGRELECTVPIWATGAEPQVVTRQSPEVDEMNGYFRVNDFLQSTSHKNVFAGGDCITMESYAGKNFPPKAGVYAVRAGPIVA